MARRSAIGPGTKVVITGAAGGLGQALSRLLGERGCEVTATDVAGAPGASTVLDVTDAAACRALAEEVRPAVWINNAGILGVADALLQDEAEIRRLVEVNFLGVVNGTRAAGAVMVATGSGTILNIGSLSAWNPTPWLAVYAATKHAVRSYSAAVAAELHRRGVRVACLCPDAIWTPMLQRVVSVDAAAVPFSGRRVLEPEEVAAAGVRLLEGRRLLASMPAGRAVLAKASGLWPALGVWTRSITERQGRRQQARYRSRLPADHGPGGEPGPGGSAGAAGQPGDGTGQRSPEGGAT